MAKKHQWKQSVRADVAAALQGGKLPSETIVTTPAIGSVPSATRVQTSSVAAVDVTVHNVRAELVRIFGVALVLVALLVVATLTDRQTHWLDQLATALTDKF